MNHHAYSKPKHEGQSKLLLRNEDDHGGKINRSDISWKKAEASPRLEHIRTFPPFFYIKVYYPLVAAYRYSPNLMPRFLEAPMDGMRTTNFTVPSSFRIILIRC